MSNTIEEPSRSTTVRRRCDVIVVGGGPAGIAAAIAAARAGADTQLIEAHGCLGGVWTAGLLSFILDTANKTGLMPEILNRLEQRGARQPMVWGGVAYDVEQMKLVLDELCAEAGVNVRLYTRLVGARVSGERVLTHVMTESKTGREAWEARTFVDATGDGDLAAMAGCRFDIGRDGVTPAQPMTLMALIGGMKFEAVSEFCHVEGCDVVAASKRLGSAIQAGGFTPSFRTPIMFRVHDDLFALMCNHQYKRSGLDADHLTDATRRSRGETHSVIAALRSSGRPWENLRLIATASHIGVRDGRRVHGRFQISRDDVIAGRRHDDSICTATFPVDVHADGQWGDGGIKAQPFDIPLRALIARDVVGLLTAGRCVGGDFHAHASYRVTGNAVATGQAAGIAAAAVAARSGIPPHEITWDMFQAALRQAFV